MEVHHHSHSEGSRHRKKWTNFLWEFLMLFLAVFCGFIAENQREHVVESKRARIYAKALLADLISDTIEINTAFKAERFRQAGMDSIISISHKINGVTVPGKFYYYSRFMSNLYTIDWNNSTINQLIQAGNLRLLKNKVLIDKINAYYASQNIINRGNNISHEKRMKVIDILSRILDSKSYELFATTNMMDEQNRTAGSINNDTLIKASYKLSPGGELLLNQYINLLIDWRWYVEQTLTRNVQAGFNEVTEIIGLLKKEYQLE
jgi:hypothetical protein